LKTARQNSHFLITTPITESMF